MRYVLFVVVVNFVACGGGTTTSGPSSVMTLNGTWSGTLTLDGVSSPTTWIFTERPGSAGEGYTTVIRLQTMTPDTTQIGASLHAGMFAAGAGNTSGSCGDWVLTANGTATQNRIDATAWMAIVCGGPSRNGTLNLRR